MKTDKDKKELVGLILKNDPGQKKSDVEEMVESLTVEQFVELLSLFSDIKDYENSMDNYLKKYAPDEYDKLNQKHKAELAESEDRHNQKLTDEGAKFDEELDSLEDKKAKIISDSAKPYEELADIYEEVANQLEEASNSSS